MKTETSEISYCEIMMGEKEATTQLKSISPCAACKLLRRRCGEECPFCPYFSPHHPHRFAAVHKVFGASNVSKMLTEVAESQRADAANSLVYEANLRLRDPVYGCVGAISTLRHQIESLQTQLDSVRARILKYTYTQPAVLLNPPGMVSNDVIAPAPLQPPPPSPPPLSLPLPSSIVISSSSSASSIY